MQQIYLDNFPDRKKQTTIKGILTKVEFKIINPKEGSSSFPALVSRPWGRKIKASVSLDKERIKLNGNG